MNNWAARRIAATATRSISTIDMQTYISWSKTLSRLVAEELKSFMVSAFGDSVKIFLSSDIVPGNPWFYENQQQLRSAELGLIIVSRRGLDSPWLWYETGALLNKSSISHKIILLNVRTSDILHSPFYHLQCIEHHDHDDSNYNNIFDLVARHLADTDLKSSCLVESGDIFKKMHRKITMLCDAEQAFIEIKETEEKVVSKQIDLLISNACRALDESGLARRKIDQWFEEEELPYAAYANKLSRQQ